MDGWKKVYDCTEYMAGCGYEGNTTFSTCWFVEELVGREASRHREEVFAMVTSDSGEEKFSCCIVWNAQWIVVLACNTFVLFQAYCSLPYSTQNGSAQGPHKDRSWFH